MTTRRQTVRRQLEQFLAALFLPGELIELRFIESWAANGRQHSRVVRPAQWLQCDLSGAQVCDARRTYRFIAPDPQTVKHCSLPPASTQIVSQWFIS